MNNFSRITRAISSTGLGLVINFMITLILVPYITEMINAEAYGWVKVAKDAVLYCTMLMLAIQDFSTRFIGYSYHRKDFDDANMYYSSVFFGNTVLGSLLFAGVMFVVVNLDHFFQLSPELLTDVQLLLLFTMLKFLQSTIMAVFECGPVIANRMYISGRFKFLSYLSEAILLIIFYHFFKPHVYWVGLAILIASLVTTVPNYIICRKYTPELRVEPGRFNMNAVRRLVGNGIWSSLNTISNLLNNGFDMVITNWMLAPLRMGQLAVVQSISIIYITIYTIVSPAFQPMILKCYSHDEHDEMMRWFYLAMKTSSFLCSLFFAGFLALGHVFYQLWIPDQDTELLYRLTVIAVIPAISGGIIAPMYYSYTIKVKKKIPFFFSVACGLLNVVSMLILLRITDLELYAVTGTTAVYLVLNHLISNGLYVCHVLEEPKTIFYSKVARCIMATAVMTAVLKLLAVLISPDGWVMLIFSGALCCIAGAVIYGMTGFDSSERNRIMEIIKRKLSARTQS